MAQSAQEKQLERQLHKLMVRFSRNHDWLIEHRRELERFAGRYVAVDGGRVVGSSRNLGALHKRFAKRKYVAFGYVDPPGPGLVRIFAVAAH